MPRVKTYQGLMTPAQLEAYERERAAVRKANGLPVLDAGIIHNAHETARVLTEHGVRTRADAVRLLEARAIIEMASVSVPNGDAMWRAIRLLEGA